MDVFLYFQLEMNSFLAFIVGLCSCSDVHLNKNNAILFTNSCPVHSGCSQRWVKEERSLGQKKAQKKKNNSNDFSLFGAFIQKFRA